MADLRSGLFTGAFLPGTDFHRQFWDSKAVYWDIFRLSAEKYPKNRMLGRREIVNGQPGKFSWMTYKEVYDMVLKVGNSIRSCGVEKGGRCGIYGANSPEWMMSMQACNAHGLWCVPLYDTLEAGAIEFIICHAEVTLAFVEEKKIAELLKTFPGASKYLKTIVSFGKVTCQQKEDFDKFGVNLYSWDDFLSMGENTAFDLPVKKKTDICTITYTSGTTGDPKGVMLSNNSIVTLIAGVKQFLGSVNLSLTVDDVYLSYLPLSRAIEEAIIFHGGSIGFWRGDVKLLVEDIAELKPTIFCAVPPVLDIIYADSSLVQCLPTTSIGDITSSSLANPNTVSSLQQKISSGGSIKKFMFKFAYSLKLRNKMKGQKHSAASPLFDKIVFSKVKQGLGGNVRIILCGAAPLASHVEKFLREVSCAYVLQSYGLTETCGGTFISLPDEVNMLGNVGPPVPNVDVCLESVPEMGYDALSRTPKGEICVRCGTLFSGYYKEEYLTRQVLTDDGWFHTGDIGQWQQDGSLKIFDRKKNIFKLIQGGYIMVEILETIYSGVPDIDSIWVYGNSDEFSLVAIINPKQQALEQWAEQNGKSGYFEDLCKNAQVKKNLLKELARVARENMLMYFEFIKAVHLDPVPFDMERDLITPTYKKKRPQMLKYYKGVIDNMYHEMRSNAVFA